MTNYLTRRLERHMTEEEILAADLEVVCEFAEKAHKAVLSPDGPKRGVWYRWRLRRAQKAFIRLHKQETRKK